jgi:hypothetical protein
LAARTHLQSQATKLGIDKLLDADELARLYGSPFENSRTPDYVAVIRPGLIYTGGSKLAEHGGFAYDDRNCRVAGRASGATVSHFQR